MTGEGELILKGGGPPAKGTRGGETRRKKKNCGSTQSKKLVIGEKVNQSCKEVKENYHGHSRGGKKNLPSKKGGKGGTANLDFNSKEKTPPEKNEKMFFENQV